MSPCSSCIHYRVTFGSLHPVEKWCVISGEGLSANDVWRGKAEAMTREWPIKTQNVPECKFTMSAREVAEFGDWYASKLILFYRENRGTLDSFASCKANQYWLDQYADQAEVEMNNQKRFWPSPSTLLSSPKQPNP